jgi:hypothetical protein
MLETAAHPGGLPLTSWRIRPDPRRRRAVDDGGEWHHPPGDSERRPGWPDAWVAVMGESSVILQNDRAALPRSESDRIPEATDDDGTPSCASRLPKVLGKTEPVDGIAAAPIYLDDGCSR